MGKLILKLMGKLMRKLKIQDNLKSKCVFKLHPLTGPRGDKGDAGLPGQGRAGEKGNSGLDGLPGLDGQKGDKGVRGNDGNSAAAGEKGDRVSFTFPDLNSKYFPFVLQR